MMEVKVMLLPPERTSYHSTAQVDCLTYCASVTLDLMHRHDVWPNAGTCFAQCAGMVFEPMQKRDTWSNAQA